MTSRQESALDSQQELPPITRPHVSPRWPIIMLTGWIVLALLLKLVFGLTGVLTPGVDSMLDIVIFGSLSAILVMRGVGVLRSPGTRSGVAAGGYFIAATCWAGWAAMMVARLVT